MADKRITLHPVKEDGTLDTDTNLYPKTTPAQVLFSDSQRDALNSGITAPKVEKLDQVNLDVLPLTGGTIEDDPNYGRVEIRGGNSSTTPGVEVINSYSYVNVTYSGVTVGVGRTPSISWKFTTSGFSHYVESSNDFNLLFPSSGGTIATQEWTTNAFQTKDSDLTAISSLTGAGLLKRNSDNTWTLDTNSYATTSDLSGYLPITGGTLSGNTGIDFNGKGTIRSRSGGGIEFYSGTANYRYFFPATDNAYVLGGDTSRWYYVNTARIKNSTTATTHYLLVPSTTGWTSDKTIATLDDIPDADLSNVDMIEFENDATIEGIGGSVPQGELLFGANAFYLGSLNGAKFSHSNSTVYLNEDFNIDDNIFKGGGLLNSDQQETAGLYFLESVYPQIVSTIQRLGFSSYNSFDDWDFSIKWDKYTGEDGGSGTGNILNLKVPMDEADGTDKTIATREYINDNYTSIPLKFQHDFAFWNAYSLCLKTQYFDPTTDTVSLIFSQPHRKGSKQTKGLLLGPREGWNTRFRNKFPESYQIDIPIKTVTSLGGKTEREVDMSETIALILNQDLGGGTAVTLTKTTLGVVYDGLSDKTHFNYMFPKYKNRPIASGQPGNSLRNRDVFYCDMSTLSPLINSPVSKSALNWVIKNLNVDVGHKALFTVSHGRLMMKFIKNFQARTEIINNQTITTGFSGKMSMYWCEMHVIWDTQLSKVYFEFFPHLFND